MRFRNNDGTPLTSQTHNPKWEMGALTPVKKAITLAENNGHKLYEPNSVAGGDRR